MIGEIWRRVRFLSRRTRFDAELRDEIRHHLDMIMEEKRSAGVSEREAQYQALRRFGNETLLREKSREVWMNRLVGNLVADIRYGVRMLSRAPVFSAVAVLSLALGIGANTAIFSLIDSLILRSLPVKDPSRLVQVNIADYKFGDFDVSFFAYPAYQRLRDQNQVFDGLIASGDGSMPGTAINGDGTAGQVETINLAAVSGNYFRTLGVNAIIGRDIGIDDEKPESGQGVAVLGYNYWKRRFGQDPAVVGRTFTSAGTSLTIVGVAPPGFFGTTVGKDPDMFVPIPAWQGLSRGAFALDSESHFWLSLMGRLKAGVTIQQAAADLNVLYAQMVEARAAEMKDARWRERYLRQHLALAAGARGGDSGGRETFAKPLTILMGIVGLVLLIACANIANLMLARASGRRKEISVRLALGAGRRRIIGQLLTESLLISITGGAAGLLFAKWGSGILLDLVASADQLSLDLHTDLRVLSFTAGVSVLTGLLFGLAPALGATRIDVASALNERSSSGSRGRLRGVLVAGQVALSLLLLIGAGLFARTLQKLRDLDLGFDRISLYQVSWDPLSTGYDDERLETLFKTQTERVSALPGVLSASLSASGLFNYNFSFGPLRIEGSSEEAGDDCHFDTVGATFFETTGMHIAKGRSFSPEDKPNSPPVAILNETAVRRYFAGAEPVGKRIYRGNAGKDGKGGLEVIGIVADSKNNNLREPVAPMVYTPYFQHADTKVMSGIGNLEVKALGRSASMISAIQTTIHSVDESLVVRRVAPIGELVDGSLTQERAIAMLSSFFGLLAMLLASIGLYGTMSYSVNRRTVEIGIRLALGAETRRIQWLILRESLLLLAAGIAIGLFAALALTRFVSSLLFGMSAMDPWAIAAAILILAVASALAGYIPARRAASVDPMISLRWE
jgi:predicted permease